jgi:hypothetical protein
MLSDTIDFLHRLTGALIELAIAPLSAFNPLLSLTFVSVVIGLIFLFIFGKISNQKSLRRVKQQIHAAFFEAIIFRHDLGVSLRAQMVMLLGGVRYLLQAIPPILVLIIPTIFILGQLNLRYGYRPARIGEDLILTLKIVDPSQLYRITMINSPEGMQITPPLRIKSKSEVMWRITPTSGGDKEVVVRLGDSGKELKTKIYVGGGNSLPEIESYNHTTWLSKMLYPGAALDTVRDLVASRVVTYPERKIAIGAFETSWIVIFFIVSLLAGIISSRILKVEI